ncbi:TOMM precursor leader peptide-binding protein [Corynebacterium kalidii]|uniref:TOMM leader peptide-binding protein n=1 Tax=Corynebacterium kalidii TaxID=2931982 RepID=A0A9X1WFH0_9CORY|nr:TOMM precursor leader peptide-binding protein [Corynebacterium kalidii]MCJ7858049.1 TOMM precursor leader peptide-binding protein [Corynebacterium kalidii]
MTSTVVGGGNMVMLRDATSLILRSPHHLQFGTLPGHSLVLTMPTGVSANQVMLVLRESMRPVAATELVDRLGHCGFSAEHAAGVLADLVSAGLLRPVPHTATSVHVTGPAAMSTALLRDLLRRGVTAATVTPGAPAFGRLGPESLVVLAGQLFPPQDVTRRLMAQGVPHLPCGVVDGRVVVGPLVLPGTTPCLTCLDTQLLSEDPEWRLIRAQSPGNVGRPGPGLTDLASSVVAEVVRDALGAGTPTDARHLDGLVDRRFLDPVTLDTSRVTPLALRGCPSCRAAPVRHTAPAVVSGSSG